MGFAGTLADETASRAVGLTTLTGDEFSFGPKIPLLPGSWDPDRVNDSQ